MKPKLGKKSCAGLIENVDFNFKSPLPTWSITALERRVKNAEKTNKNKNKGAAKGKVTTIAWWMLLSALCHHRRICSGSPRQVGFLGFYLVAVGS